MVMQFNQAFVQNTYNLGLYINDKMTWKKHVITVGSKIEKDC